MAADYREQPAPLDLRAAVECVWVQQPSSRHDQLIVPDGCIDLIWLAGRELIIAGADTGPRSVTLAAGTVSTGVRLRPGAAGAYLRRPASELRDVSVRAAEVLGAPAGRLAEELALAGPRDQLRLLAEHVRRRRVVPDRLVTSAAQRLTSPAARIATVADALGVSERQLHRRTIGAVGYAPKMLARTLRLRRLTTLDATALADRALAAGYASQSHMSDEIRALTGLTASRYLTRFDAA